MSVPASTEHTFSVGARLGKKNSIKHGGIRPLKPGHLLDGGGGGKPNIFILATY